RANKPIGDKMIMNAAFLVSRDREQAFDANVKAVGGKYSHLTFRYTGPWPPYNFVDIRLKLERATPGGEHRERRAAVLYGRGERRRRRHRSRGRDAAHPSWRDGAAVPGRHRGRVPVRRPPPGPRGHRALADRRRSRARYTVAGAGRHRRRRGDAHRHVSGWRPRRTETGGGARPDA